MTDEILEKLSKKIHGNIDSESDVVYILVQLGRLFERDGISDDDQFRQVTLFRNWSVHNALRWSCARYWLDKFEQYLTQPNATLRKELSDFALLYSLRRELCAVLKLNKLPDDIVRLPKWFDFQEWLLKHISDIPLEIRSNEKDIFSIDKLVYKTRKQGIDVEVSFKDGDVRMLGPWMPIAEDDELFFANCC
ncbi:MAG: hypothetical protein PHT12_01805 [Patescibacteria group bacterium]|nr:hypothetical protein [Patescibacteria group bacterium]